MDAAEALMQQVLEGATREERRRAFVALMGSESWRLVLAPHVVSRQCYEVGDCVHPDRVTFADVAPLIAAAEEKIHRCLELLGTRFADELLRLVARHMGPSFVEHGLDHLRTAEGERATQLERILYEADPRWVLAPGARRAIRTRLRSDDRARAPLIGWLADAGNLGEFIEEMREHPPRLLEEWSALGRAKIIDETLVNRALALVGSGPEPLAYLLRLEPAPEATLLRMLAAAKPEWLVAGLEVAIVEGLASPAVIPVAELAIRLGGRHLAAAMAWLGAARLGPEILRVLARHLEGDGERRLGSALWSQRRAPSANRALEQGRRGETPDPFDAAALVRQLQGARMLELVQEVLAKPRESLTESVLHPLCAVNPEAAAAVVALGKSLNPDLARRAREVRVWPDVLWPKEEDVLVEPPPSFTPLGEGI